MVIGSEVFMLSTEPRVDRERRMMLPVVGLLPSSLQTGGLLLLFTSEQTLDEIRQAGKQKFKI